MIWISLNISLIFICASGTHTHTFLIDYFLEHLELQKNYCFKYGTERSHIPVSPISLISCTQFPLLTSNISMVHLLQLIKNVDILLLT